MESKSEWNNLCMGCMERLPQAGCVCPRCGFDNAASDNAAHQLPVRSILAGKYLVGRALGQGGFGVTYIGWDLNLNIKVAIKEYYPEGLSGREQTGHATVVPYTGAKAEAFRLGCERFVKEAQIAAHFGDEPCIVNIRDYFKENGTAYIVMEFVEGKTLKQLAGERGGKLYARETLDLLHPLLGALSRVHDEGLLHRDISPDNIILRQNGTLKLLDFGAARQISMNGEHSNTINVKHGFAPVEQYSTHGEQGPWTDVYALCATIYRLTTGKNPPQATDRAMFGERLTPPNEYGANFTEGEQAALLKGLAIQPKDRIRDMGQLEQALFGTGGQKAHARPAKPAPRWEKAAEPRPEQAAPALRQEKAERPTRKRPSKRIIALVAAALALIILAVVVTPRLHIPARIDYRKGEKLLAEGQYQAAVEAFRDAGDYSDAAERVREAYYREGEELLAEGQYQAAVEAFDNAGDYDDATERVREAYYSKGEELFTAGQHQAAVEAFLSAGNYSDATERAREAYYNKGKELFAAGQYQAAVEAFLSAGNYSDATERSREAYYRMGEELFAAGQYQAAIEAFINAGDYSDATERVCEAYYSKGEELFAAGQHQEAIAAYRRADGFGDSAEKIRTYCQTRMPLVAVTGRDDSIGIMSDGTVLTTGDNENDQYNVSDWTDIVAVSASYHTVGLKADGTVLAAGGNWSNECNVSKWSDIVAVAAGYDYTVGLKADGTVVATGYNKYYQCSVSGWTGIVTVAAGFDHTVGLKADGTVVATGLNSDGQRNVFEWTDIVAVTAGIMHTVGIRADGTVVATGDNSDGQCNVSEWTDIVAVSAGYDYTVGIKTDGTVVAVGENRYGQCNVSEWTDIVAVAAGRMHTVGIKADGTVVATGDNQYGQCNVSGWKLW